MSFINTRDVIGDQATLDGLVAHTLTELKEDAVNTLATFALHCNSGIVSVEFPNVSFCGSSVFYTCRKLTTAAFPKMTFFASYMFHFCTSLTDIYAPSASGANIAAFKSCSSLKSVNLPGLTTAGQNMFDACTQLSMVSFSTSFSYIRESAFQNCHALNDINFPNVTTIGACAFLNCTRLSTVSLPRLKTLSWSAFQSCPIKTLVLPMVSSIGAFVTNYALKIDIGSQVTIGAQAFYGDANLFRLLLRSTSIATLNNYNALVHTPIEAGYGRIYVPGSLVSAYRAATNWTTYAEHIESIDNYTDDSPVGGVTDTWAEIIAAEQDGTYLTKYHIGDLKWVAAEDTYYCMQIIAFDTDELADNSGNAHITWLCKGYYNKKPWNSTNRSGSWLTCELRAYLRENILPSFEQIVLSSIKEVNKTYKDTDSTTSTCIDTIWVPSLREITGEPIAYERSGCTYTNYFTNNTSRIKLMGCLNSDDTKFNWWTRSGIDIDRAYCINNDGSITASGAFSANTYGVVFGFCT